MNVTKVPITHIHFYDILDGFGTKKHRTLKPSGIYVFVIYDRIQPSNQCSFGEIIK